MADETNDSTLMVYKYGSMIPFSGLILKPKNIMLYLVYPDNSKDQIVAKKYGDYIYFKNKFHKTSELGIINPTEVNVFFVGEDGKFSPGDFEFDAEALTEMRKIDNSKKRDRIFERIWIGGNNKFQIPNDMINLLSTAITVMMVVILIYIIFINFPQIINAIYQTAMDKTPELVNATIKAPIKVGGG